MRYSFCRWLLCLTALLFLVASGRYESGFVST